MSLSSGDGFVVTLRLFVGLGVTRRDRDASDSEIVTYVKNELGNECGLLSVSMEFVMAYGKAQLFKKHTVNRGVVASCIGIVRVSFE